jgi:hypothetical protein
MKGLIDFWSVPHFLFGVVMALAAVVFGLSAWLTFFATFVIAILWEILEARFDLGEISSNVISDILLPLLIFPGVFFFASRSGVSQEHRILFLVITFSFYTYVNAIAWKARLDGDPDFKS